MAGERCWSRAGSRAGRAASGRSCSTTRPTARIPRPARPLAGSSPSWWRQTSPTDGSAGGVGTHLRADGPEDVVGAGLGQAGQALQAGVVLRVLPAAPDLLVPLAAGARAQHVAGAESGEERQLRHGGPPGPSNGGSARSRYLWGACGETHLALRGSTWAVG